MPNQGTGNLIETMDLRPSYFGGLDWYEGLREPRSKQDEPTAWYCAKDAVDDWYVLQLNAGLAFADEHGLHERYRKLFAGIRPPDLLPTRAKAERRTVSFPIWEIANELIVGRYLERVIGWQYREHEPRGRQQHRGDWEFESPRGRRVFVEVKSLQEPDGYPGGVFNRSTCDPRIRDVLAGAYKQLPEDDRATLVILVGQELVRVPAGIMHGDIFQSLFGKMQVTFRVMPYDPESLRMSPSFRDMFTHGTKHRRLGAVAGLDRGHLAFYAIHNPYAHKEVRTNPDDFPSATQFIVDDNGRGEIVKGISRDEAWERFSRGVGSEAVDPSGRPAAVTVRLPEDDDRSDSV